MRKVLPKPYADLVREGQAFRVARIYRGDPADGERSPLLEPGVGVVTFGEVDGGGTQVLYLSHVPFSAIGLPDLGTEGVPQTAYAVQEGIYYQIPFAAPVIVTDINSAELIKHASNSFLALKISYMIWLDGSTVRSGGSGSMACSLGGCFGFGTWSNAANYEATIWSFSDRAEVGHVNTSATGQSRSRTIRRMSATCCASFWPNTATSGDTRWKSLATTVSTPAK